MSISPRYASRYPRPGKFAILCEGDLAAYEADLLEIWFASQDPPIYVDVWPCGTRSAIFGMADAVGRAVPYSVIEDRDYRTIDEATKDCAAALSNRKDRGTHVRSWRAWNRHEIENYLIEPEIVAAVLALWFGITENDVLLRLGQVIVRSAVDQAAQFALSSLRSRLPDGQQSVAGLPRNKARPIWSEAECSIVSPSQIAVEQSLLEVTQESLRRFNDQAQRVDAQQVLASFKFKVETWSGVQLADQAWRCDWAGKEILLLLNRWLAGEFGWPAEEGQMRQPVNWSALTTQQAAEKDREIAVKLQPDLVRGFLRYVGSDQASDVRQEWNDIVHCTSM